MLDFIYIVHNIIINRFLIFLKKKIEMKRTITTFAPIKLDLVIHDRFIDSKNKNNDDTFPAGLWITSF